ncbi:MAG: tyrosine-type recombinase/integrase [Desulfoplanes sp.]|nr:tyrosine-type recombinase/integrase [Desulfoplanes sp.]
MLSHTKIASAKPEAKDYSLSDGQALSIQITKAGTKRWRFRYRYQGKAKMLSLGLFPKVGLAEARAERDRLKKILQEGIDPSLARKLQESQDDRTLFGTVAREWFKKFQATKSEGHQKTEWQRIESNLIPFLGERPINEITSAELLHTVRKVESRGALEQARRVLSLAGQIFRYGVASCLCDRDPSQDLKGALTPPRKHHYPAITDPDLVGKLMKDIDAYQSFVVRLALRFQALTFVRPGEIRFCEWEELDLETNTWTIPANKMKAGKEHMIPLSTQAIDVLNEIHSLTCRRKYVFTFATQQKPLSDNTLNTALRRMGYSKEQMVSHGFRSMASTLLNELGFDPELIEVQLAHVGKDKVRAAYCRAEYIDKRRSLMQAWADYLVSLQKGGKVTPIRKAL